HDSHNIVVIGSSAQKEMALAVNQVITGWRRAVATVSHDSHNIVVIGSSAQKEMALAVNQVITGWRRAVA
ncbi:adenine deaminase C-terminal domain-containing protein, partial [Escherichia coli]